MFCENFLSLIDCLITPKNEVQGTSLLFVLVILKRAEDELELIPEVVAPLRTKEDVEAKEEQ